jgi:leucyl-tRNA synthetase
VDKDLDRARNLAIKKVGKDIGERFNFNTAISAIMEFVNALYKYREQTAPDAASAPADEGGQNTQETQTARNAALVKRALDDLVLILSPFTPHLCEELWELTGHEASLYGAPWPEYDEAALMADEVIIVVQVNGKVKGKLSVASGLDAAELETVAASSDMVDKLAAGREIVKIVAVPDRLVNVVVK